MSVEEIRSKIVSANSAYRTGTAIMTDSEFDALVEEYASLVPQDEFERFRDTLHETKGKVKIEFVMGSLNKLKVQEPATIRKFVTEHVRTKLNVSAKVDGISCRIRYVGGKLVSANTRGDGYWGEDLTDKIPFVNGALAEIPYPDPVDVRGELVIMKDDFEAMGCDKNSRNVCAGILNRKRSSKEWNDDDLRMVSFVAYTILDARHSKAEQFELLEKWGFQTPWHDSFGLSFVSDTASLVDSLAKYATQDLPYAIDGVVISDDSYVNEEKYRPNAQAAVKTNALEAVTTLIDVAFEGPKKDGAVVPVAILEPVEIGDAVIARASVHNLDFIAEKGLRCGCKVRVVKGGDIIPVVAEVVSVPEGATEIVPPAECPCCGSKLVRDGVNMRCANAECHDQKVYRIMHFIKKLGVMNASFKTVDAFGIDSVDALLAFSPSPSRKSETNFCDELRDKVFSRPEPGLFCAMNMMGLGETLQRKIVEHYGWDRIKEMAAAGSKDFNRPLPDGVGDVMIGKFAESFSENVAKTLRISSDVRFTGGAGAVKVSKKTGISVCFTGKLETMGRAQASALAARAGFEVKSSVSKGLTYLVTNDTESGSSKNEKARKFGTKIIDEKEFLKMVGNVEHSVMEL